MSQCPFIPQNDHSRFPREAAAGAGFPEGGPTYRVLQPMSNYRRRDGQDNRVYGFRPGTRGRQGDLRL